MDPYFSDSSVTLYHGDCLDVLRELPDCSVDSVVCDPPYGLANTDPAQVADTITRWVNGERDYLPGGSGFMGKAWDAFVPPVAVWDDCLRVLKPGGHVLAFAGSRTMDLMTLSLRLAGFDIRDSIAWLYGSGFPKSLDVSKAIDKANGRRFEDRFALGRHIRARREAQGLTAAEVNSWFGYRDGCQHWERQDTSGARVPTLADWHILRDRLGLSDEHLPLVERAEAERAVIGSRIVPDASKVRPHFAGATYQDGYASKSADITVPATDAAQQWQGWGTALKPAFEPVVVARKPLIGTVAANVLQHGTGALNIDAARVEGGRWPTNAALDESQAAALDESQAAALDDQAGAETSRFFYVAKAPTKERPKVDGVAHPTVKPLALMRWLVRLVTSPGGTVLEPFAGSGTTAEAALLEGFQCIAIEREAEYLPLIQARLNRATSSAPQPEPVGDSLFDLEEPA